LLFSVNKKNGRIERNQKLFIHFLNQKNIMDNNIIQHLSQDPKLGTIIPHVTLPPVDAHNDIYLDLLDSIVSQQLSVKAAGTIFNRFIELFDGDPSPHRILEMDVEAMRGCGLSYQKAGYIKNVAAYWIENRQVMSDWLSLTDDDIIERLTTIKGVGKWTVQMILMFRLNRLDVFPVDDLGIRQGMVLLYGIEETGKSLLKRMVELAEPWRPYRSVACRYIWRYKDTVKA
jgi:DNA-3-methyladenine glycosylase II